jgi:hypothetical protein
MASSGKKKTTMAKLMRESRLRERRLDKQLKKDARKLAAAQQANQPDSLNAAGQPAPADTVVSVLADDGSDHTN